MSYLKKKRRRKKSDNGEPLIKLPKKWHTSLIFTILLGIFTPLYYFKDKSEDGIIKNSKVALMSILLVIFITITIYYIVKNE